MKLSITHDEVIQLYQYLKPKETELDINLLKILRKLENYLYDKLTIEEIEKIEKTRKDKNQITRGVT